jgi:hypothetical protein
MHGEFAGLGRGEIARGAALETVWASKFRDISVRRIDRRPWHIRKDSNFIRAGEGRGESGRYLA